MLDGLLIDVEGTLSTVQVDDTNMLTRFYGLQKRLGCEHLNKVLLPDGIECWVDDEGLYNAAFNPVLTLMTGRDRHSTPLLGSGLFLGRAEATGETRSLTAAEKAELTRTWLGASSIAMLASA